jgi:spore maturation protein CgeB
MRFLILNTDYPKFLRSLYEENPGLEEAGYDAQMTIRNDSLFGVADYYSRNFRALGHEAVELHVNNRWMQHAWARQHGLSVPSPGAPTGGGAAARPPLVQRLKAAIRPLVSPLLHRLRPAYAMPEWEAAVLAAQIADFRPDVILNQEMTYLDNETLKRLKPAGAVLIGQIAATLPSDTRFDAYDLVISSLPNLVDWFRRNGVRAQVNRLAFEPSVLDRLGPAPARDVDVSFVGSLSPEHSDRILLLEAVARELPLKIWGNGIEALQSSSPLHACYQGEAWGRDMYKVLRRSRVTLNSHLNLAGPWANNMRLYEATGMGTMLLTDAKHNLAEIFTPGEEVVTYANLADCVAQARRYLADESARATIAAAGQRKAVEVQSYARRVTEIAALARQLQTP